MKKMNYFLLSISIVLFYLAVPLSVCAGLTEEELETYKKILPKKLTAKEISEWTQETTYKNSTLKLQLYTSSVRLRMKEYLKLEKKQKVRIRIVGGIRMSASGKKQKPYYKGAVNIYVITTGETPKVIAHKKVKQSKLCPT
jgi:hypothetical protein